MSIRIGFNPFFGFNIVTGEIMKDNLKSVYRFFAGSKTIEGVGKNKTIIANLGLLDHLTLAPVRYILYIAFQKVGMLCRDCFTCIFMKVFILMKFKPQIKNKQFLKLKADWLDILINPLYWIAAILLLVIAIICFLPATIILMLDRGIISPLKHLLAFLITIALIIPTVIIRSISDGVNFCLKCDQQEFPTVNDLEITKTGVWFYQKGYTSVSLEDNDNDASEKELTEKRAYPSFKSMPVCLELFYEGISILEDENLSEELLLENCFNLNMC